MCGVLQDQCVTCCGDGSILYIFISHINVLFLLQTLILNMVVKIIHLLGLFLVQKIFES